MSNCLIISVLNQKGGVGKTTTVSNLCAAFAANESRVLAVDFDPQGNLSSSLGIEYNDRKNTIYEALTDQCDISDSIIKTEIPNLDVITSNVDLSAFQIEFVNNNSREFILKNKLSIIKQHYDFIFIDCPPSLGLLTVNALVASDRVIVPVQCEFLSLEGLSHMMQTIELVHENYNTELQVLGILLTMYDKRNKMSECIATEVRRCLGKFTFETVIPRNVKVSEAPSHGKPVIIYDHRSTGSVAYVDLTREILCKIRS